MSSFIERMLFQGAPEEKPKREWGMLNGLLSGVVEDDSGEERIPYGGKKVVDPRRVAEAMLVPTKSGDLLSARRKNGGRGLLGQLFGYVVAPVAAIPNAIAMSWTPEPEKLMTDGVVDLERRVKEVDELEGELNGVETKGFFEMLATQILQTHGPIREASTRDPDESMRLPTNQERWLASELAIELARSLNKGIDRSKAFGEWLGLLKEKVEKVNFAVLKHSLEKAFTEEELLRIASELRKIIESYGGELELVHIPPSNLILAAIFAAPSLLDEALSAAFFPSELGKKGVSIVLRESSSTGKLELRVLMGGAGRGENTLPGDAQPEWTQPLMHEIVTDTELGHKWVNRWRKTGRVVAGGVGAVFEMIKKGGRDGKGIWQEKMREARFFPKEVVEAGRFRLVNPHATGDMVEIPLAVRRSANKPSSIGGALVYDRSFKVSGRAKQIVDAALKIAKEKANRRGVDWRIALEGSPRSKDDSLRRAYEETVELLLREGIREEVVRKLAIQYAKELSKRGGELESDLGEISFDKWKEERSLKEQELLKLVDELTRLNKRMKQAKSPELKAHWKRQKKIVLRRVRELSSW